MRELLSFLVGVYLFHYLSECQKLLKFFFFFNFSSPWDELVLPLTRSVCLRFHLKNDFDSVCLAFLLCIC